MRPVTSAEPRHRGRRPYPARSRDTPLPPGHRAATRPREVSMTETPTPPPTPQPGPASGALDFLRHSQTLRLLGIGVLVLLLQIPIAMVEGVIRERQGRRAEATFDVQQKWGGQQRIVGAAPRDPGDAHATAAREPERVDATREARAAADPSAAGAARREERAGDADPAPGNLRGARLHVGSGAGGPLRRPRPRAPDRARRRGALGPRRPGDRDLRRARHPAGCEPRVGRRGRGLPAGGRPGGSWRVRRSMPPSVRASGRAAPSPPTSC